MPFPRGHGHPLNGPGSITGSILEEDENSSDDGTQGKLAVHENRPQSRATGLRSNAGTHNQSQPRGSVMGVPSVNTRARPLSTTFGQRTQSANGNDSDSDAPNYRSGGRRAASDVGAMGYRPPTGRTPLRRTFSDERGRPGSDRSSIRSSGSRKKKRGFFASLSRMFKGTKKQDRSGSPPYGSSSKSWHTRTDTNIKRSSSMFGSGRRGGDDSSSDDEAGGNFVAVSNQGQGHWSVDNVGRPASRAGMNKRNSTSGPVASGLIPQKPVRAKMNRNDSQSTVTGRATPRSGAATPTQRAVANAGVVGAGKATNGSLSRSNTMKSSASAASVKSGTTAKSSGTVKKTRANGSISRSTSSLSTQNAEGRTIMSLVDMKTPPPIEVPKAPKSQVNPQMELPKAPGSSLVPPAPVSGLQMNAAKAPPAGGLTRSRSTNSVPAKKAPKEHDSLPPRATTPLPPSRLLSPPLKSALRPTSPNPSSPPTEPARPAAPPPQPMFSISAPGPVNLPVEAPKPISIPAAAAKTPSATPNKPEVTKRNSYHSMTSDAASIYESAQEDGGAAGANDESSGSESDEAGYQVVDNERVKRLGINVGPPHIERVPSGDRHHDDDDGASESSADTATYAPPSGNPPTLAPAVMAPGPNTSSESTVSRRKSVRMAVPDSPGPNSPVTQTGLQAAQAQSGQTGQQAQADGHSQPGQDRAASPESAFEKEQWSTRIGRMRDDTSSESDHDDEYLKARKGLSRNSGKWELDGPGDKKKSKRLSKAGSAAGSVKSKSSVRRA